MQKRFGLLLPVVAAAIALLTLSGTQAAAQEPQTKYSVLYNFCSQPNCTDGRYPNAGVIRDEGGNLYGTTYQGGSTGYGVVFKLDPSRKETVLYNFCSQTNCTDGGESYAGVIRDEAGNLYGTTSYGGSHGYGVVFKLDPSGKETVLYNFCSQTNCTDGEIPYAGLIRDEDGNLYGTTYFGGIAPIYDGYGVVFKLDPSGKETVLHTFTGGADGGNLYAGVIRDEAGNLYGSSGAVFKLDPSGKETVLYNFCSQTNCTDGSVPFAGVIRDAAGNLYGTTVLGGDRCSPAFPYGCGVVFKLDPSGKETVLYTFTGKHGAGPQGGLTLGDDGSLYGTTSNGGYRSALDDPGRGVVFKVDPEGKETLLHAFNRTWEGGAPFGVLLMHNDSPSSTSLYGTANGGLGYGVIFKVMLTATE